MFDVFANISDGLSPQPEKEINPSPEVASEEPVKYDNEKKAEDVFDADLTDSFDFNDIDTDDEDFSLEMPKLKNDENAEEAEEKGAEDASDVEGDDDDESTPYDDDEDDEVVETEEVEVEGDVEVDDEEVDYENHVVTLPDGSEVNLSEAVQGYKTAEQLQEIQTTFETQKNEFMEGAKGMMDNLALAELEADKAIGDYDGFDWTTLSREDPKRYADNREFLDKYKARKTEIVQAMAELKTADEKDKQEKHHAQARVCVTELKADIIGWNEDLYKNLMTYATGQGIVSEEITQCVDPAMIKLLNKAYMFDKGKATVKAKVRRTGKSPKKVLKTSKTKAKISKRSKAEDRIARGETSGVFGSLID